MNEEKLHDIEATIAHQDQQIQDLSEMVTKQWDEISAFKTQLARIQGKLEDVAANPSGEDKVMSISEMAAAEKPPHY